MLKWFKKSWQMRNLNKIFRFFWGLVIFAAFNECNVKTKESKPKLHIVEIKQMQFQPATLTVNKGDTVEWINRDMVAHDVTEEPHKAWTSSSLPEGASWRMVVKNNTDYYCSIHQVMKGKLIVNNK